MAWRAWLPDRSLRGWLGVTLGAALAAAATGVRLAADAPLGHALPFITYFPALIIASAFGGLVGGLSCLIAGTAAVLILGLPPTAAPAWLLGSFWISGALVVLVAAAMADSVRELRRSRARLTETQGQLQTLVSELAHRNRNALAVVMAIVSQSARSAQSAEEAERVIISRLEALSRAQEVVVNGDGASAALQPLLEKVLEPFGLDRFAISPAGEVALPADVAIGLGLLFHELATNALKYGALSAPEGRVQVAWTLEAQAARLTWREAGGPPVAAPARQGFGARLLAVALVPQGGGAERRFEPDGVVCELRIPLGHGGMGPGGGAPGQAFARAAGYAGD